MRFVWILWFDIFSFLFHDLIKNLQSSRRTHSELTIILSFLIKAENKIVDDADKRKRCMKLQERSGGENEIVLHHVQLWDAANVAGHCDLSEMSLLTNSTPGREDLWAYRDGKLDFASFVQCVNATIF